MQDNVQAGAISEESLQMYGTDINDHQYKQINTVYSSITKLFISEIQYQITFHLILSDFMHMIALVSLVNHFNASFNVS